ncbi:MAG: hypothetical protein ABI683_08435 [Ginsengibacter sp.]
MLLVFGNLLHTNLIAQPKKYTFANTHAHNDYMHDLPFYTAFNAGFGSIEADVYPVNDTLFVAHNKRDIRPGRTLQKLYILPLLRELGRDSSRHVKLLVDVKENYNKCLDILLKELLPLKKFLLGSTKIDNQLIILISGDRPPPSEYKNYPGFIFFDDDLKLKHNAGEWSRVGQVSLSLQNYTSWKGDTVMNKNDSEIVQKVIDSVHMAGKTIRFWAAPDTKLSWKTQMNLGVDLIGTDKIKELAAFIKEQE